MATSTTRETAAQLPDCVPDSPAGVLAFARDRRQAADAAEVDLLKAAVAWAVMHPADSIHHPYHHPSGHPYGEAATYTVGGVETDVAIAGEGAPTIAEFAVAEFATCVGKSTEAGKAYLGQALELRYRLPRLWNRLTGGVPAWKARAVARETIRLSPEAADWVDRQVAPVAGRVGPTQLDRLVNEAIGRHMPDEVQRLAEASWDTRHVTIYDQLVSFTATMTIQAELDIADALDLDTALAAGAAARAALGSTESLDIRRAQALGDLSRGQVALDLDTGTGTTAGDGTGTGDDTVAVVSPPGVEPRQVVLYVHLSHDAVQGGPGADPVARLERGNTLVTVDQVRAWCGSPDTTQITLTPVIDLDTCTHTTSDQVSPKIADHVTLRDHTCVFPWCPRPARRCDRDHVIPRAKNGHTCSCNIAPLCRRHHRLKTHSPWTYHVVDPGTYVWTSPHGYQHLRDPNGTHDITPHQPTPARPPDT